MILTISKMLQYDPSIRQRAMLDISGRPAAESCPCHQKSLMITIIVLLFTMSSYPSKVSSVQQSFSSLPQYGVDQPITPKKKRKRVENKYCGVCGDITMSYHFGGLCCNSCKSFFRRSIENDSYLRFFCGNKGHCILSISNRKNCRYCRMNRCLAIGMSKDWLQTEDKRKISTESENKRNVLLIAQGKSGKSVATEIVRNFSAKFCQPRSEILTSDFITPLEIREMEAIVDYYHQACQSVCFTQQDYGQSNPLVEIFGTVVKRFYYFAQLLPEFSSLPFQNQKTLLKASVLEMSILRLALVFDPAKKSWSSSTNPVYNIGSAGFQTNDISRATSSFTSLKGIEFISSMQQMGIDELTIMLLCLITLFSPERSGLIRRKGIEKYQIHFTILLERYIVWRYGRHRSTAMYGKLLMKLSDLREFGDSDDLQNLRKVSDIMLSTHSHSLAIHNISLQNVITDALPTIQNDVLFNEGSPTITESLVESDGKKKEVTSNVETTHLHEKQVMFTRGTEELDEWSSSSIDELSNFQGCNGTLQVIQSPYNDDLFLALEEYLEKVIDCI